MIMEILIILGTVILVSAAGNVLFGYTGIPESVFMIILGLIIGPILNLIPPLELDPIVPYLFTLSLIVVLFETGISIELSQALKAMKKSSLFTIIVLIITVIVSSLILPLFGWELHHSIIVGIIISGTSTAPVVYFTSRMTMKDDVKTFLVFESILNDITLLTALTITIQAFTLLVDVQYTIVTLTRYLLIPIIYSSVAAIFWIYTLIKFSPKIKVKYLSTIAFTVLLYAITEMEKGSGVLAIVIFSLLLGNLYKISKTSNLFHPKIEQFLSQLDNQLKEIRGLQSEISFMVKNLFFFIMGILFNISALNNYIIVITVLIISIVIFSRLISAGIISSIDTSFKEYTIPISLIIPRGLTVGLAAFLTIESTVQIPSLDEIVVMMVIITTIVTTISFFVIERWLKRKASLKDQNNSIIPKDGGGFHE